MSEELRDAMRTRDMVNMAKGVLMARESVDERTAFLLMTTTARADAVPLRDVAQRITGATTRRGR